MTRPTPEQVDAILPQTQCGLCGFGGCMPYAEALVYEQAGINLCPPGGLTTLKALGSLLGQDHIPYEADMTAKAKPVVVATIREDECIGCTKCIQACPVDAILGAAKQMHTIITSACTGCELCVPPCPVDCIDLKKLSDASPADYFDKQKREESRQRYNDRLQRMAEEKKSAKESKLNKAINDRRDYIKNAIARAKAKKPLSTSSKHKTSEAISKAAD